MAWECLRTPLVGHFLLCRFAFEEADPDLALLAILLTQHPPLLWVQPEQIQVCIMSLPKEVIPGPEVPLHFQIPDSPYSHTKNCGSLWQKDCLSQGVVFCRRLNGAFRISMVLVFCFFFFLFQQGARWNWEGNSGDQGTDG